jgi:hypothetical protein
MLAGLTLGACSMRFGDLGERESYWRSVLATDLRPGTSLAQVETYLSQHGVEHGYDKPSRLLRGIERNVAGDGIVSWSITLSCQFGPAKALVACAVGHVGTGP